MPPRKSKAGRKKAVKKSDMEEAIDLHPASDSDREANFEVDSEEEELDKRLAMMKKRIIDTKRRRLEKLEKALQENEEEEKEEEELYKSGGKPASKSVKPASVKPASKSEKPVPVKHTREKPAPKSSGESEIDITLARQLADLEKYKKSLSELNVKDLFLSDSHKAQLDYRSDSNSDSENEGSVHSSNSLRCSKRKKKIVSGEFRCGSAVVKKSVIWPHETLDNQFCVKENYDAKSKTQKGPKHKDLDFRALVIGELNVVRKCDVYEDEKSARLELLANVAYNSAFYKWEAVLQTHATVLREVENGYRNWGDSYSDLMARIQAPFPKRVHNPGAAKRDEGWKDRKPRRLWFCSDFNDGGCKFTDKHVVSLKSGRQVEAHHICANCYKEPFSLVKYHSKSDSNCPNK